MNERIRKLARQSGLIQYDTDSKLVEVEKFTELIVQECLLCCERVISDPVPKTQDTWLNGGLQCMEEIKHNFGVEDLQNTIVSNHS